MPLFGRKKVEEKIPEEFKEWVEKPVIEKKEEIVKLTTAPLFVKLERYGNILESINEIKATVLKIKNALAILSDLDNLRNESLKLIKDATDAMENRITSLDSEFLKPSGLEEKLQPTAYTEGLEDVLTNLKEQVSQLKTELENIS